jgi:hypothetical protein
VAFVFRHWHRGDGGAVFHQPVTVIRLQKLGKQTFNVKLRGAAPRFMAQRRPLEQRVGRHILALARLERKKPLAFGKVLVFPK